MARKHSTHVITHLPVGTSTANTIHYRLLKQTGVAREATDEGDKRTAYAQIVTKETVTQEELEEWIAARNPLLNPSVIHLAIDALMRGIMDHLKVGRKVTLKNQLTFGVSFEGCIDPERPLDVRHLPLVPWTRFTPKFINTLNTGVRVAYDEPFLPPRIKVKTVKVIHGILQLTGEFRHPEALAADLLTATGEVIPCEIAIPATTTRPFVTSLTLLPATAIPTDATLQLQWINGANEPQKLELPLTPSTPKK